MSQSPPGLEFRILWQRAVSSDSFHNHRVHYFSLHMHTPLDMKGCIGHFVKWQIHPFISKGTNLMWPFKPNSSNLHTATHCDVTMSRYTDVLKSWSGQISLCHDRSRGADQIDRRGQQVTSGHAHRNKRQRP